MTRSVMLPSSVRASCGSSRCESRRTSCFEEELVFVVEESLKKKASSSSSSSRFFLFFLRGKSSTRAFKTAPPKRKEKEEAITDMITHDDKVGLDGGSVRERKESKRETQKE